MMKALARANTLKEEESPTKGSARYPLCVFFTWTNVTCSKGMKRLKESCWVIFALKTHLFSASENPLKTWINGSTKV
jgi:hypothetical protein